jgi:NAD(P)-dependent dehydrogenase (short-subunit alcohol dehydrogenase family)
MNPVEKLPDTYRPSPGCLSKKIILVTGAGDGIGKAAALSYARYGATVILLGKTEEKLEAVYDQIEQENLPQAALCPFDLMNDKPQDYKHIAETIEQNFGRLDGLLHNAGILGNRSSIENYRPSLWMEVMQVNLNACFLLTQALLPCLKKASRASIIFTSSGVGRQGRAHWGAYAVSKFATEGLMQTLADELEEVSRIRVNCLNPGATRTRMRAAAYPAENPQKLKTAEALMPLYVYLMADVSETVSGKSFDAQ